jgi:hypothetical protein
LRLTVALIHLLIDAIATTVHPCIEHWRQYESNHDRPTSNDPATSSANTTRI